MESSDRYDFTVDAAHNLLRRETFADGVPIATTEMPRAPPHERPASVDQGSVEQVPLVYDANGNLIEAGTRRYVYDAWNRLVRVE